MSICRASRQYAIPKVTLIKKLVENQNTIEKSGPPTVLSAEEEAMIVTWIMEKARIGYPMHPNLVKLAIQSVLKKSPRPNPFKNNLPGDKWFKLFLKRHPEISLKHHEVLYKSREAVTEKAIREWFDGLYKYFQEENAEDILSDPSTIFNMDEIEVPFCPRSGKLLGVAKEKE